MGLLWLYTIVFLLSERCDFVIGVDDFTVQFEGQKTCFEENTHISLVVDYTGSGTPDSLRWKFSKMSNPVDTLNIVTSICIAGVADPAFPVSRMSYTCDNHKKSYTINITDFNESSDAGTWEVAISVDGAFTNFKSVTVTVKKCPASSDSEDKWWIVLLCLAAAVVLIVILCFICKNLEKIWKFLSELFNCGKDDYPSDPSFPNPQQPGGGGTIHGNPGNANREERGTEVTPETPPSQTAEKANTTPPKVQESYLSRPESSDPKSKQGRSGLDQSEKKTQRNDPPQDEHRENRRDRLSRFQPRRLPNFMRNMWRSLSLDVCKSASNLTVNDRNDPDKETGL